MLFNSLSIYQPTRKKGVRVLLTAESVETVTREVTPAKAKKINWDKAEVVRDPKITAVSINPLCSISEAIKILRRMDAAEQQEVDLHYEIDVFPLDGARALTKVLESEYGFADARNKKGMWGETLRPDVVAMEVGPGQTENVVWGRFGLPGVDGYLDCAVNRKGPRRMTFVLNGCVRRKDEPVADNVVRLVKKYLETGSVYRGGQIKLLTNDEGLADLSNPPTFMDLSGFDPSILTFSRDLEDRLGMALVSLVVGRKACIRMGVSTRSGVLLSGTYGVGKTLYALYLAWLCKQHGRTFVYTKAEAVPETVEFIAPYTPALIFAEDLDQVGQERNREMEEALDGISTKGHDVIVVFTTNHPERIHDALRRKGRMDSTIEILPPDPEAVDRLIQVYGSEFLEKGASMAEAAEILAGQIPATIHEAVKRSKRAQVWEAYQAGRLDSDTTDFADEVAPRISSEAMAVAAQSVISEREWNDKLEQPPKVEDIEDRLRGIVSDESQKVVVKELEKRL